MHTFNRHPDDLAHRKCTLTTLQKSLGIVGVYKNTSIPEEQSQAILDIKADDIVGKWGVLQVCEHLANHGALISWYGISFHFYLYI